MQFRRGLFKMYLDSKKTQKKITLGALIALMCLISIPLISLADGTAEPASFATDLAFYAGAFSTAVTASVNPTATMAVLSILGAIENAAVYSPDSAVLCDIANFLNGIPIGITSSFSYSRFNI